MITIVGLVAVEFLGIRASTANVKKNDKIIGGNVTSFDVTRPARRQLQLRRSHLPSNVNNRTSTAHSAYRCASCPWLGSQSPHHASYEDTSLATCPPLNYFQNRYFDAPYTPPRLLDISLRSSTFCQH